MVSVISETILVTGKFDTLPTKGLGPYWLVGGHREPSDVHPPATRAKPLLGRSPLCSVGRTQLPLSHKQTSSDPTRRFRQFYDWGNLNAATKSLAKSPTNASTNGNFESLRSVPVLCLSWKDIIHYICGQLVISWKGCGSHHTTSVPIPDKVIEKKKLSKGKVPP